MTSGSPELLDDIALLALAPGRGGAGTRTAGPLSIEYIRDLTAEDIDILNSVPLGSKSPAVQQLRYSHHMLARLLASGKKPEECAGITGHAVATVRRLQTQDPAFRELIAHYREVRDQQFLDAAGRLAVLGMTATEELQERLEESPKAISNRELKEIVEMAFDRSVAPAKGAKGGGSASAGSGVTVNVSFVGTAAQHDSSNPPTIEVTTTPQIAAPVGDSEG